MGNRNSQNDLYRYISWSGIIYLNGVDDMARISYFLFPNYFYGISRINSIHWTLLIK